MSCGLDVVCFLLHYCAPLQTDVRIIHICTSVQQLSLDIVCFLLHCASLQTDTHYIHLYICAAVIIGNMLCAGTFTVQQQGMGIIGRYQAQLIWERGGDGDGLLVFCSHAKFDCIILLDK